MAKFYQGGQGVNPGVINISCSRPSPPGGLLHFLDEILRAFLFDVYLLMNMHY